LPGNDPAVVSSRGERKGKEKEAMVMVCIHLIGRKSRGEGTEAKGIPMLQRDENEK